MNYGALSLLDHQMIDREGRACGNVDDLEFELAEDGTLRLVAILAGPGVLAERLGRPRLGAWLRRASGDRGMERIPWWRVSWVDSRVRIAADSDELATFARERWARDRLIARVPGSGVGPDPEELP